MTTVVLVTGGFDPLHSGHIAYFEAAKRLGDELWVGLNSDSWLANKKGRSFMPVQERASIVKNLGMVDRVVTDFDDSDGSASGAIHKAFNLGAEHIVFANGGDRGTGNTPEQHDFRHTPNMEFVFGIGGEDKKNSSSWILKEWQAPKTEREWGHYRELYSGDGFAVKELVIAPHSSLSMQRHQHRSETWNIVSGQAHILMSTNNVDPHDGAGRRTLSTPNPVDIPKGVWHQGVNESDTPAHIVEIWKGPSNLLSESDIERFDK
jgi:D-beta-D-heptose 7-phosphate kinase/D-beta-D-heptose 1-phosphate adenosyltransferase